MATTIDMENETIITLNDFINAFGKFVEDSYSLMEQLLGKANGKI